MATEDSFDIFGSDPFGRDYLYGLSTGRERLGLQSPPQGLQLDTRPYDQMQATPRGFTSGLFSDVLGRTFDMPALPRTGIPALDLFAPNMNAFNRLSLGDVQKTAERISYGEPLTTGSGMTLRPRDETIFAGMAVAPFVGEAASLGARAGRAGARMVGQGIAENVAMGRPNLPSMFAEPRSSLFAVKPGPSMAAADESSAMRQQLTGKMQALLAQKKMATSAVEVGAINQQIGKLQAQFKSLPAVGRVAREVVAPQITAPVSDLGFYSAAEQAAMNLERSKGTGQSFLNDLMNAPDVKKDELSWIGLDDFLKDKPNVTKQEVQDFIASNKIDLQEVRLGGNEQPSQDLLNWMSARNISPPRNPEGWQELSQKLESYAQQHQKAQGSPEASQRYFTLSEEAGRISEGLDAGGSSSGATKYQKYQLAGGENYREILLKLPQKETRTPNMIEYEKLGQQMFGGALNPTERARLDELENLLSREERSMALSGGKSKTSVYQSSHFNEPNILAHIRVNDRVDADGKKMLLVEEIQSDWHQAGREKGYKGKGTLKELPDNYFVQELKTIDGDTMYVVRDSINPSVIINKDYNRQSAINGVINELNASSAGGVPDAPFKDTWYQLSLKRILKYAADNGYERVGLTTGKRQVERFSDELRQNVDQIDFSSGYPNQNTTTITATKNGQSTFEGNVVDGKFIDGSARGKTIDEVLGKSIAQKIQSHDPSQGLGTIKGDDLTIGGEGMKKYYDEIYPKFLEKYGKKWDAGVGETQITTDYARDASGIPAQRPSKEPIRYIDITPKMKEGVKKGQPLAAAEQTPEMLASGGLDYADPFRNPLLESSIG